jgi:N-acetylglucosaminylphosphatidylinositol deacetylase
MTDFGILETIQKQMKFLLSLVIITNFFIIFFLKFSIKIKNKFFEFFNVPLELRGKDFTEKGKKMIKEVLLIISHPDDEIMFFSPTIKFLFSQNIKIRILCLSNGNFDNLGKVRESELAKVCKELRIEDFEIIYDEKMQDNIKVKWDDSVVASTIQSYMNKNDNINNIGTIITFDEWGVTKHPNHISANEGLITYLKNNREIIKEKKINSYLLDTHNPISQYTIFIPFVFFFFKEYGFFNKNPFYSYKMMKFHTSQFNTMRKIHMLMSSYSYFNSYTKIELS